MAANTSGPDRGAPCSPDDARQWAATNEHAPELDRFLHDPRFASVQRGDTTVLIRSDHLLVGVDLLEDGELRSVLADIAFEEPIPPPAGAPSGHVPHLHHLRLRAGHDPARVTGDLHRDFARLGRDGRRPAIGPNHVLLPTPGRLYGPADSPVAIAGQPELCAGPEVGEGVRVVVLDTGVQAQDITASPWLDHRIGTRFAPIQDDPFVGAAKLSDRVGGHGHFVAGRIVQQAPGATVEVISVADLHDENPDHAYRGPAFVEESRAAWALSVALSTHPDVVNMSFGGPSIDDLPLFSFEAALIAHAADASSPHKAAVVASAGNDATTTPYWPAAFPDVIAVGAVDSRGVMAPFSNRNPDPGADEAGDPWVDCYTWGVHVESSFVWATDQAGAAFDGWASWSGTSFAAPRIAGRIAATAAAHGGDCRAAADALIASATTRVDSYGVLID
jgi:hypothetical protein